MATDFDDLGRDHGDEAIRAALDGARWAPDSSAAWGAEASPLPISFAATPFAWRDPATIPRRQFLYGFELRRKQASGMISPGAVGKTTLKVGRALCMVTGREFFGHRVWNGPHRVWLWNLEDEIEEVEKTVHAYIKLWDLDPSEIADRLYIDGIDSAASRQLKIAVEDVGGAVKVQRPVSDALVAALHERRIDYLDVDPFVSSHSVNENSNTAIDAVAKEWVDIAHRADCAINLTHHIRKPSGGETTAHDARGASAMVNAARSVLVLSRMTKENAEEMRIAECDRRRYLSVYDDKNNKSPPASKAEWYEFSSIGLGNGDDTGPEDNIGALKRWYPPDTFAGVTPRQLLNIQRMVDAEPDKCRKHSMSPLWVGKLVAAALDLNLDDQGEKNRVKAMLSAWISNGAFRTVDRPNARREVVEYIEVGQWAEVK